MKTVVLMITCKRFEQVWDPFFILFKRFWPECKYEVFMGTDEGHYSDTNIKTISLGQDFGWSNNFLKIINQIQTDRIILFLEDFLPNAPFDNNRINYLIKHSFDYNIGCLRINPCPGPTAPWPNDESLGILQSHDSYRLSTQTAIWKKQTLLDLVIPNETAWQTEIKGTKRAAQSKEYFVSVKRGDSPISYINTAITKGIWREESIKFLESNGISINKITKYIK